MVGELTLGQHRVTQRHGIVNNGLQQAVIKKSSVLSTLLRLMDYKTFKGRTGPEDKLAIEVAIMLRVATLEGRLLAAWTHIPHEVAARGKFANIHMAKAKALGLIKGSCDYVFAGPTASGWIELKSDTGSLSPEQRDFRDWCQAMGANHAVCRSVAEVREKLFSWGLLIEPK